MFSCMSPLLIQVVIVYVTYVTHIKLYLNLTLIINKYKGDVVHIGYKISGTY